MDPSIKLNTFAVPLVLLNGGKRFSSNNHCHWRQLEIFLKFQYDSSESCKTVRERDAPVIKNLSKPALVLCLFALGCGADGGWGTWRGSTESRQGSADERAAIIERMVPEEGPIPQNRLRIVIQAINTVDKEFEMENPTRTGVRRHLSDRNLTQLRRIEANFLAIEKKRRADGLD
jgi:hypothetical protein